MPRGRLDARAAYTYRVPEIAVAGLIERLGVDGEWLAADAEADVVFDHPSIGALQGGRFLALRFGLSERLAALRALGPGIGPASSPVYAAGAVEEILLAAGFRQVSRTVTLRQAFHLGPVGVQLVHVDPLGWFCELRGDPAALGELERELALDLSSRVAAGLDEVILGSAREGARTAPAGSPASMPS